MDSWREDWWDDAACLGMDPDIFHPPDDERIDYAPALAVCATCPVTEQCLELGMTADDNRYRYGVFGGKTPAGRKRLRAERLGREDEG